MDWSVVVNQLIDMLMPTIVTAVAAIASYIGLRLKTAYEQNIKSNTAEKIIKNVVQCVQQTYKDLDGPAKLEKAVERASAILASKKIDITEEEITMLIESAVYGLKNDNQNLLPKTEETKK